MIRNIAIILIVLFVVSFYMLIRDEFVLKNIENISRDISENLDILINISNGLGNEPPMNISIDFSKICPYKSLCSGDYVVDNNKVFCKNFCVRKKDDNCNYNKICESFESDCIDCQCFDGILCGGICYRNTDFVCDNGYMREEHGFPEGSLEFEINFPRFLEKDKWVEGNVIIINNNEKEIENDIYWSLDGVESNIDLNDLNKISLEAGENRNISFSLMGKEISDRIVGKEFLDREPEVSSLIVSSNTNSRRKEFVVYKNGKKCGDGEFNYRGNCVEDIFFLGSNCDNGSDCLDKMNWWNQPRVVKANGVVNVGLVFINAPEIYREKILNWTKKISEWYSLEGEKYTGKNIINLSFIESGNYIMDIDFKKDLLPSNLHNSKVYQKRSLYDINIVVVQDIPSIKGDPAAINYNGRFIALKIGHATDITIAHEIAHSFGCSDVYDKWEICKTRWKGSLMCEEAGKKDVWGLELGNCAGEIGWGDNNNNRIIDIEEN